MHVHVFAKEHHVNHVKTGTLHQGPSLQATSMLGAKDAWHTNGPAHAYCWPTLFYTTFLHYIFTVHAADGIAISIAVGVPVVPRTRLPTSYKQAACELQHAAT